MKTKLFTLSLCALVLASCNNESPELPGVFSVGKNKQIQFSPGLLQYKASTDTWRFAKSQLDFIGENNLKASPTYNGWIDLFGYGCSGYDNKYPWQTSKENEDYAPRGYDGITGTEYDWGIHCQIQNGGPKGSWRLPTCDDWYYLLSRRENAKHLATLVYVDSIKGLLLLPDGWENTLDLNLYFSENDVRMGEEGLMEKNHLTKAQWKKLEKTGAVLFPFSGVRWYNGVILTYFPPTYSSSYWCSTSLYEGDAPWILWLTHDRACCTPHSIISQGTSVRLVKDVK